MDKEIVSILLAFFLYCLYVLVPLIPARYIYKWFPNSQVTASGVLSNFKINASGAFAAYIVTVLLGYFIIDSTKERILSLSDQESRTWVVKGGIELRDKDGGIIEHSNFLNRVSVNVRPDVFIHENGELLLKLPGTTTGDWPQYFVTIDVLGFGRGTINLTRLDSYQNVKLDYENRVIEFNTPIPVTTINDPNQPYITGAGYLEPAEQPN